MLGGYLEFFMESSVADMYQSIRRELDEFIQSKVSAKNYFMLRPGFPCSENKNFSMVLIETDSNI